MEEFVQLHSTLLESSKFHIENQNENLIQINYLNGMISYTFKDNSVTIEPKNFDGYHIFRLVNLKLKLNYVFFEKNYVIEMGKFLEIMIELVLTFNSILDNNYYNNCTCCSEPVEILGFKNISTCSNDICKRTFNHIPTKNLIYDSYNSDKTVTVLLINFLISCCFEHPKKDLAFNPIPLLINVNDLNDFTNCVPNILKENNLTQLIKILDESSDDLEIYFSTDNVTYAIIKNSLESNYFDLTSRNDFVEDNSIQYIHINYPPEIENKFHYKPNFLFHGAGFFSWYPIIKNGLKILSGTALQANGAAYGQGIYMSDSLNTSLSYSTRGKHNNLVVVGVFQLTEDNKQFKKAPSIFVIPNEKILLLRSLIVFDYTNKNINSKSHNKVIEEITNYYKKDIFVETQNAKTSSIIVKNKRLKKEIEIFNSKNIGKIKIIDESANWEISSQNYIIQFHFISYPLNAPNIIFISGDIPKFLIDTSNNIKLPILHPNKWNIKNTVSDVVEELNNIILENYFVTK
jgi:ubiquitin-protein ligase